MFSQQALYLQVADLIKSKIEHNEFTFGECIPSERNLSETYGINRMTVRKAISLLSEEGLLIKKPGKGTFVSNPRIDSKLDAIQGTSPFLYSHGLTPSTKLIYSGQRPAGIKLGNIFCISPAEKIYQLFRIRLGNNEPLYIEYTYIPYSLICHIENYDFSVYSLYDVFREHGIFPYHDEETIEIVKTNNPQASILNIPEGEFVFLLKDIISDRSGKIIEFTKSYSSGDKFNFKTTLK